MRAPAKPRPRAADEVARVVRVAQMLGEEIWSLAPEPIETERGRLAYPGSWTPSADTILEVADRIAARTED